MKKKKITIIFVVLALIALLIILIGSSKSDKYNSPLVAEVKKGEFEIPVKTTGELQAKKSVQIRGPEALRNRSLGIREVKILDLIPEGTVVDSGDYVARLDKTETLSKLKDIEDELEKRKSEYIQTKLDTAMELKKLRNQLIDLKYTVEEREIKLKQSKYEPPATQRQAKIELERAKRELRQARDNYQLKVEQAEARMSEVSINLAKQKRKKSEMEALLQEFTIHAPQPGMVIYKKGWDGKKRTEGSTISPWDLTVATLPDLSTLISKTYVNEIDISKVKEGQPVRIQVDAFPDKKYNGTVTEVANIGQELKNTGAKVFEVSITLNETDSILRPSMTTSNEIITRSYQNVKYLPLEAVHSNDSLSYVYTTNPGKQVIEAGQPNENYIIVKKGLKGGEKVLLTVPDNSGNMKLTRLKE
jgi:multidrug efflux pump subunit AcrA (membrane-fusion protein)